MVSLTFITGNQAGRYFVVNTAIWLTQFNPTLWTGGWTLIIQQYGGLRTWPNIRILPPFPIWCRRSVSDKSGGSIEPNRRIEDRETNGFLKARLLFIYILFVAHLFRVPSTPILRLLKLCWIRPKCVNPLNQQIGSYTLNYPFPRFGH